MQGHEWNPAEPHQANEWLQHFAALWWIAGGWAIELFLEQTTRAHTDLDVGTEPDHAWVGQLDRASLVG